MSRLHLEHLDAVDAAITRIDKEVDGGVESFRFAIEMLCGISGISSLPGFASCGRSLSKFHNVLTSPCAVLMGINSWNGMARSFVAHIANISFAIVQT
jgi:hypothetical protein